jgi:hypothetical protein
MQIKLRFESEVLPIQIKNSELMKPQNPVGEINEI